MIFLAGGLSFIYNCKKKLKGLYFGDIKKSFYVGFGIAFGWMHDSTNINA